MAEILSRGDIVNTVAAEVDMPKNKVDDVIKAFENAIARHMGTGDEVRMAGFGTFKTSQRSARTSRNPRTGEPVEVPARVAPSFKAGKALKDAAGASSGQAVVGTGAGKKGAAKADAAPAKAPAKGAAAKGGESKGGGAKAAAKPAAKAPAKPKVPTKAELTEAAKTLERAPTKNKKK